MPFFLIFGVLLGGVIVTAYRAYDEPFTSDVTLVVGAWNLLNLLLAGCALGVVSERGEKASTRRVKVSRRCEFNIQGKWCPATIVDVSVHGARIHIFGTSSIEFPKGETTSIRFKPYSGKGLGSLPVSVRNVTVEGQTTAVGCKYTPTEPAHHQLIADLLFANSSQWTQFQASRRFNPGLMRGTIWFLGLSLYQTYRGVFYLMRTLWGGGKGLGQAQVEEGAT